MGKIEINAISVAGGAYAFLISTSLSSSVNEVCASGNRGHKEKHIDLFISAVMKGIVYKRMCFLTVCFVVGFPNLFITSYKNSSRFNMHEFYHKVDCLTLYWKSYA